MLRSPLKNFQHCHKLWRNYLGQTTAPKASIPKQADVVIIGGGSAGCYTLYHLARRGVQAVLLERFQLTSGTTWHTNGLMWRIRPSDTDIQLLNSTRDTVIDITENTEYDPGWIQNGGIFIARNETRLNEYRRLATIAKVYNIEHSMLTTDETLKIFPLLNPNAFVGALHSPGDGIIDPTMLCNALTKLAVKTKNAQVFENCAVTEILTEQNEHGAKKIVGLKTELGEIKTKCVVNATGAWGRDLIEPFGISLPLIPMKHSYVVSEPINGIQGLPNLRDHDASIAFRVQGSSVYLGGYENNPILLDSVPHDFQFSLYDLDWSTFDDHIEGAVELCPPFGQVGIKTTICGPETFTPDHKPIMGPDPRLIGLFHNCGFNSAGMMFGGGCGEQIAEWIIHGRPELYMFDFDIRRFTSDQMADKNYMNERCHEAYAENYSAVFLHNQPLAGRNFQTDALHNELIQNGAVMEEKCGWERAAWFCEEKSPVIIPAYDWYGAYGHAKNTDKTYVNLVKGDQTYGFSEHHDRIGAEALNCRTAAALFNLSSFSKILVEGPDAKAAVEWICTNDINQPINSIVQTLALNKHGGIEAQFIVIVLNSEENSFFGQKKDTNAYYIVADGIYGNHTLAHINEAIIERGFRANVNDLTNKLGILSIQGPNSRQIVEELTGMSLGHAGSVMQKSIAVQVKDSTSKELPVQIMPTSSVGESGYELHIENQNCVAIYKRVIDIGQKYGLKNAGFRAYNSLNCEAGNYLWGSDLRPDDTPIEANLASLCRKDATYQGSNVVVQQQNDGINKRLVSIALQSKVPIWGLEGVYCNGNAIGYLRRANFGHFIKKPIAKTLINCENGIDWTNGTYEIDVIGQKYPAELILESPLQKSK